MTENIIVVFATQKQPTYNRQDNLPSVDIVICTKDRPDKLRGCIGRFKRQIPHQRIIVYDGSAHPDRETLAYLKQFSDVEVRFVNGLLFGAVRRLALEESTAEYVAMVDDDIYLSPGWFDGLMMDLESDPQAVAVSSKLVYTGHPIVQKLSQSNLRTSGGSGGAAIYNRHAVIELGNFSSNIHRGEDMELELRIQAAGKRWRKSQQVYALHPVGSVKEFLGRPSANVVGWNYIMAYSKHKWLFMAKRFASTFVMPVYYLWSTGDLRASGVWFIFKLKAMLSFLSGRYQR